MGLPLTVYNIYWVGKDLTRLNVNMNTSVADENVDDLKTYLYNVTANDVIASTVKEIGKQFRQVNKCYILIIARSKKI